MRAYAFGLFLFTLVLLHFLLHVGLGLGDSAPDLLAVAVLLAARRTTLPASALLGVVLGVLDDALGIGPLGPRSIALAITGVLGTWSRGFVEGDGLLFFLAYLFVGIWASDILLSVVTPGTAASPLLSLVTLTPLVSCWTALWGVALLALFRRVAGPDA